MRICTIYLHTNTVKNNIHNKPTPYVGRTWQTIKQRANNGKGYELCTKFWRAICKYRWENFSTLELATVIEPDNSTEQEKDILQDQANYLECLFQDVYDSKKNGYNIKEGGSNGRHSPESIQKISDAVSGEKHPFFGKHHSLESREKIVAARAKQTILPETGKKISEANTGSHRSPETIAKMSIAQSGPNNPMFGKTAWNKDIPCTPEVIQKMSDAKKGKPSNHKGKYKLTPEQIKSIQNDTRRISELVDEYKVNRFTIRKYKKLINKE